MSSKSIVLLLSALTLLPAAAQSAANAAMRNPDAPPKLSALDVPIEEIAASDRGGAVLDKDIPGLRSHTMYGVFKSMSLHQIAALSHGRITPEMLAQAEIDLSTLPGKTMQAAVAPLDSPTPRDSYAK